MENLESQIEILEKRIAGDTENFNIMKGNLADKKKELAKLKRKLKRKLKNAEKA